MKGTSWDITTLPQMEAAVAEITSHLNANKEGGSASVLALSGDLGAGKTTFTQVLAKQLGVSEALTSPTFVIMKKYPIANGGLFRQLVHVDAYRLDGPHELEVLGFAAELSDKDNLVVVEWADKVADLLPSTAFRLHFNLEGTSRTLKAS